MIVKVQQGSPIVGSKLPILRKKLHKILGFVIRGSDLSSINRLPEYCLEPVWLFADKLTMVSWLSWPIVELPVRSRTWNRVLEVGLALFLVGWLTEVGCANIPGEDNLEGLKLNQVPWVG